MSRLIYFSGSPTAFLSIAFLSTLVSCVTTGQFEVNQRLSSIPPLQFSNEEIDAKLTFSSSEWVSLSVKNKSPNVVTLVVDQFTFNSRNGDSSKLIPEGAKYIDATKTQVPISVAPEASVNKAFFADTSVHFSSSKYGSGWVTEPWVPLSLEGASFVFAYRVDGKDKFIVFKGDAFTGLPNTKTTVLGTVSVKDTYWNPLFVVPTVGMKRDWLDAKAQKVAEQQYGSDVQLINKVYSGSWNWLSLLFYFSTLGFVEDATLQADVISTK